MRGQLTNMKKLGYADPRWSLKVAVQKQIEIEDRIAWARRKEVEKEYIYKPSEFHLTETAKYVFGKGIQYAKLLRL